LIKYHLVSESIATLAIQSRDSSRKFLFDKNNTLCGWMNQKIGENIITRDEQSELFPYSFSGVQVIDPKIFKYFPDKDIFSLVELYLSAARKEKLSGYVHNDDLWIDIGKLENLNKAEKIFEEIRNTYRA
jgi:NDP-sugar pyrophosphorylase family protein